MATAPMDMLNLHETESSSSASECEIGEKIVKFPLFSFIHNDYDEFDCEFLKLLGMTTIEGNVLKRKSIETIAQLKECTFTEERDIRNIKNLPDKLMILDKPMKEILFTHLFSGFRTVPEYEVLKLRASGDTLEDIGLLYELSRERVRQKEVKAMAIIHPLFQKMVNDTFLNNLDSTDFIPESYFFNIADDQECADACYFWWKQTLKKTNSYRYLNFANGYLLAAVQLDFIAVLEEIRLNLIGDFFDFAQQGEELEEAIATVKETFTFMTCDIFLNYLEEKRYHRSNQYVFQGSNSAIRLGAELVASHFPQGIYLGDDLQLTNLKNLLLEIFDVNTSKLTSHALKSGMKRYLVACGKNQYIHRDKIFIDTELLQEIVDYTQSLDDGKIYDRVLFQRFQGKLCMASNVDNE